MTVCCLLGNLLYYVDLVRPALTIIDAPRTTYETTNTSPAARSKRHQGKPGEYTPRTPRNLQPQEVMNKSLSSIGGYLGFCLLIAIFWGIVFGIVYLVADIK